MRQGYTEADVFKFLGGLFGGLVVFGGGGLVLWAIYHSLNETVAMGTIVILFICLLAYFVPSVVAHTRKHKNEMAICVLNVLLGWTFVGWVVALVWASTDNTRGD